MRSILPYVWTVIAACLMVYCVASGVWSFAHHMFTTAIANGFHILPMLGFVVLLFVTIIMLTIMAGIIVAGVAALFEKIDE